MLINAVGMQCIATTAGAGIVESLSEIVATEEPFEAATCSALPNQVAGKRIRFNTRGDHRVSFQRLLIKASALVAAGPETVTADRPEMISISHLRLHQPAKESQPK